MERQKQVKEPKPKRKKSREVRKVRMSDRGAQVYGLAWMGSKFSWKVECSAQDGEWSVDVWWQKSKLRDVRSKVSRGVMRPVYLKAVSGSASASARSKRR